jgi:hypothetical protein
MISKKKYFRLSNILAFSIADEGYYKDISCALKWISKFLLGIKYLSGDDVLYDVI